MAENAAWRRVSGVVFDVQHCSIHDGPGIRTTVFLKGCPLGCWWCQNPEARSFAPELLFNSGSCRGCGACVAVCPAGSITLRDGRSHTDRARCDASGRCVEACPNQARSIAGRRVTAGEVFDEAASDFIFYADSEGGITISGGDPLAQPEFSEALLRLAHSEGIHTAVDTCGYAAWPVVRKVCALADLVLYDIKHMDPAAHQLATGVSNALILENARRIHRKLAVPMRVRVPVIPEFNDSAEHIGSLARFVRTELGDSTSVDLIPYHRLGIGKRELLQLPAQGPCVDPPPAERMESLRAILASLGIEARTGG